MDTWYNPVQAQQFIKKLERQSKSARQTMRTCATRGRLRRKLSVARQQLDNVVSAFQCVLHQMCIITFTDHASSETTPGWDYRWKPTSEHGYDVGYGNRCVDYGNMEYATILQFLYLQDQYCQEYIDYLVSYWPSIHPASWPLSNHAVEMQGDVIEIFLAALRGHDNFTMTNELTKQNTTLPKLFQQVVQLCQLVQCIDASVKTGRVKATHEVVIMLNRDEDFCHDEVIAAWNREAALHQRGYVLHALLNV